MFDAQKISALVQGLLDVLPPGVQHLTDDLDTHFKAVLTRALEKMDCVTQDEFAAQTAVLARCRQKLTDLEAQVAQLSESQP